MLDETTGKWCITDNYCMRGSCAFWDLDVNSCAIKDALNKYLCRSKEDLNGNK